MATQSSAKRARTIVDDDSNEFLKKVSDSFQHNDEKTATFEQLLKESEKLRMDYMDVQSKAMELCKDHPELLLGFFALLPRGCEVIIAVNRSCELGPAFVRKIKERLGEQGILSFLRILKELKAFTKSIGEVYKEVSILFADHQDLIRGLYAICTQFCGYYLK